MDSISRKKYLGWSGLIGLLVVITGGCAKVPESLDLAEPEGPSVSEVRLQPDAFTDNQVRWGGTIVSIENLSDSTLVQIVSRPLSRSARPMLNDRSDGRFMARVSGFLDPKIYLTDREISIVGKLDGSLTDKIGEAEYAFPVVAVKDHHLWSQRSAYRGAPYPLGYPNYGYPYPYYGYPSYGYAHYSYWWNDPFYGHYGHHRPTRITGGQSLLRADESIRNAVEGAIQ